MTETAQLRAAAAPPEPQHPTLAAALAAVQAELPDVGKTSTGKIEGESKTSGRAFSYQYKYADLAAVSKAVMPLLGRHGLAFTARPTLLNDQFFLAYSLMHTSGEREDGVYPLPDPQRTDPKKVGSAITYARRYCLCAATGVAPDEDDDGAAAGQAVAEQEAAARRQRNAPPEVDKHGAATLAEQTRMVTGPEPGATRHAGTDPADEFYTGSGLPEDAAGSILPDQKTRMFALFGGFGMRDKPSQVTFIEGVTGVRVASRNDLSVTDADRVLRALEDKQDAQRQVSEP